MKRPFAFRSSITLSTSAAALLTAGLLAAPAVRAQAPSPAPTAASSSSDDIFDVIKKGADKLQKEARAQKDLAPQLKQVNERQAELLKYCTQIERRSQAALIKQEEEIKQLQATVAKLEKECTECKESAKPAAPLPSTEPAVKPTPAPSPAPTPTATASPSQT